MADKETLKLAKYEDGTACGTRIKFVGCSDVFFSDDSPTESSLLLDVGPEDEAARITIIGEGDWSDEQQAGGLAIKVLTPYGHNLDEVELEVRPA